MAVFNLAICFFCQPIQLPCKNKCTSCGTFRCLCSSYMMPVCVRLTGIEPALREKLDPKSSASTSSATGAIAGAKVRK